MSFTVLHVSDLHLSEEKFKDFRFVRTALLSDLGHLKQEGAHIDLVVFSGDLVQAGDKFINFQFAYDEFITPLFKSLGLPESKLFIVPGNHDLDRAEIQENSIIESGQFSSLSNRELLNSFVDKHIKSALDDINFRRLRNYHEFRETIVEAPAVRHTPFFSTYITQVNDRSVGIACFNTAWRATSEAENKDYGRLLLGERAVTEALNDLNVCNVRIAVFHHPLAWLREFDREDCRSILIHDFDLILTGHLHRSSPELHQTPLGRAIISEGGAIYVSRRFFNGYALIDFRPEDAETSFTLRRYEDTTKRFDVASNVIEGGKYSVQFRELSDLDQIFKARAICRALRPFFEEMLLEGLIGTHSQKDALPKIDDYYIPVELARYFDRGPSPFIAEQPAKVISEEDLIAAQRPVLIHGASESGKTMLGRHLGLLLASSDQSLRIPVFLDLSLIKAGTDAVERAIRKFLSKSGIAINDQKLIEDGRLMIVIDNYGRRQRDQETQERKTQMIESFIKAFSNNKYILLSNYELTRIAGGPPRTSLSLDHEEYFILPMTGNRIREVAQKWLEPAGLYNKANINNVIHQLDVAHLPRSAHVVSVLLWGLQNDKAVGPLNEATIIERFVEAILNKSRAEDIERSALDFKLKENFLAHLAQKMASMPTDESHESYFMQKNDVVQFTLDFFKKRSWPYDGARFIDNLLKSRVLIEGETDDVGTKVSFRYDCLGAYFVARYMDLNESFLNDLLHADKFFKYSRELEIYTGLTRGNRRLTDFLITQVKALCNERKVDEYKNILEGLKAPAVRSKALREALETMNKELMELFNHEYFLSELRAMADDIETREERDAAIKYFRTNALLSKAVRNSELVDDETQKVQGVDEAIDSWCYFGTEGIRLFDRITRREAPEKVTKPYDELSDDHKRVVELFLKCHTPLMVATQLQDHLGTMKLKNIFSACFVNTDERNVLKRLYLLFLLIDIGFSDPQTHPRETMKMISDFGKRYQKSSLVITLLICKLTYLYRDPALSEGNVTALENEICDLFLTTYGVPGDKRGLAGRARDAIIKTIREGRNQAERDGARLIAPKA